MNTATIWMISVFAVLHVGLASFATVMILKDKHIKTSSKWVHGLLAWMIPVLGCIFSTDSFLAASKGKDIVLVNYTNEHTYGDNEIGDGGDD